MWVVALVDVDGVVEVKGEHDVVMEFIELNENHIFCYIEEAVLAQLPKPGHGLVATNSIHVYSKNNVMNGANPGAFALQATVRED